MPTDAKCCLDTCPALNDCYFILIYFPLPEISARIYYLQIPTQAQEYIHKYKTLISLQGKMLEDSALYENSILPRKCT